MNARFINGFFAAFFLAGFEGIFLAGFFVATFLARFGAAWASALPATERAALLADAEPSARPAMDATRFDVVSVGDRRCVSALAAIDFVDFLAGVRVSSEAVVATLEDVFFVFGALELMTLSFRMHAPLGRPGL